MRINIITLFPDFFREPLGLSIPGRAAAAGLVEYRVVNLRDFAEGRYQAVDDYPYGGGAGMVLKPEPFFAAVESLRRDFPQESARSKASGESVPGDGAGGREVAGSPLGAELTNESPDGKEAHASLGREGGGQTRGGSGIRLPGGKIVLMSARGKRFRHTDAVRLSLEPELTFLCGHYKDVDQRVPEGLGAEEISLGDFVLSGGEVAALAVVDAVVRLLPGAISDHESASTDSHYDETLSAPSYTRPALFRDMAVPEVLLSGDHRRIAEWREEEAERLTRQRTDDS